jgi:hypothetical protein
MRLRSLAGLFLAFVLLFATGVPGSFAQYDPGGIYIPGRDAPGSRSRRSQERSSPYYGGPSRYQPAPRPVQPYGGRYQPAPPSGGFFFPWFTRAPEPAPAYRPARRRERPEPREVRRRVPNATPAEKEPTVEPSTFLVVFGDSLADLIADGLDEIYEENLDLDIERKVRGDSGLVRADHYDWPKALQEFFISNPKITFAIVMLGANDRQAIREGEVSHDPLSDRWREIYRDRVDAVVRAFTERRVAFIWVGLPPIKNDKLSADFLALNEIYRDRVQRAGGVYVDIWEAFVNDENHYSPVGPDIGGQVVRLRRNDGVHFTGAGSRKAAHFVDVQFKRLLEARAPSVAVTPPAAAGGAISVDRVINAALPALPEPPSPSLAPRPIAGPVLPLTRVDVSPGGTLASGQPRLEPDTAQVVERALREGVAPLPKSGRADDFSWPK